MRSIYRNEDFIVVIKEVNIDSEKELPELINKELNLKVYPVHRLDKNVGGLMVYALNKNSARELSLIIEKRMMQKNYLALVSGIMDDKGTMDDLLFKDSSKNKVFIVKRERKGVKRAILEYETLKTYDNTSLVKVYLHTGRSHQIRVQFASRKHPLIGDHKYGAKDSNKNPMLYSHEIIFDMYNKHYHFEDLPSWANNSL